MKRKLYQTNSACSSRRLAEVAEYFASTSESNLDEHPTLDHTQNPKKSTFNFKMTSTKDIRDILMKLKRKKASGYDDIPTSLIVDEANEIAGPLSKLINRCLKMAVFPSTEKCSKITPVYKSGERTIMDNYRPIAVFPVISKVFERVVHNQLHDYLETNDMLSERQFGFRNKSCNYFFLQISSEPIWTKRSYDWSRIY